MLVLTRKTGEQIEVKLPDGSAVTITAVRLGQHSCRIGITAPRDCPIVRSELIATGDTESTSPELVSVNKQANSTI